MNLSQIYVDWLHATEYQQARVRHAALMRSLHETEAARKAETPQTRPGHRPSLRGLWGSLRGHGPAHAHR